MAPALVLANKRFDLFLSSAHDPQKFVSLNIETPPIRVSLYIEIDKFSFRFNSVVREINCSRHDESVVNHLEVDEEDDAHTLYKQHS